MVHPKSEIFWYYYFDINRLLMIAFFMVIAFQGDSHQSPLRKRNSDKYMGSNTKKKPCSNI